MEDKINSNTLVKWDSENRVLVEVDVHTGEVLSSEVPKISLTYNDTVGDAICRLIEEGETFKSICSMPGMPSYSVLCRWRRHNEHFSRALEEAKKMRADLYHDEIHELAKSLPDEASKESVNSMTAKVSAYKWLAGVGRPDSYSPTQKHTGADGGPLKIVFDTGIRRPGDEGYEPAKDPGKIESDDE